MKIVNNEDELMDYLTRSINISSKEPILLDQFLENAIEVDIDAVSDGTDVLIGGILEQIEPAGIHSGDSMCLFPPFSLTQPIQDELHRQLVTLTKALKVIGPINVQFAVQGSNVFILEANLRASRTIPFISKALGLPLAKIGTRCMLRHTLIDQNVNKILSTPFFSLKIPIFPFNKFPDVDPLLLLGPEMLSTGELMSVANSMEVAIYKAFKENWLFHRLGSFAFLSSNLNDLPMMGKLAKDLISLGFSLLASEETAQYLLKEGICCQEISYNNRQDETIDIAIVTCRETRNVEKAFHLRWNENYFNSMVIATVFVAYLCGKRFPYSIFSIQDVIDYNRCLAP